jgi:hypothetical protein
MESGMSFGNQWTFFKPRKKKNFLFSSASPHRERGTGENDNFTIGATNFRNNSVQKIGEHYKLKKSYISKLRNG